ncbi:oxysterol-binding protein-related protein 8 isoform X2 [Condylostylus longicornis]|uniref:oxysterol-binding protein-related protein 8 isoform X2 n=1 Tax=Condylostylus longicornis TaxID=2530218 RepID=UPI00244E1AF7|nr:oxysterol-binding protein-related protein 8 isoform X2 [Condylostylus longicornis]
MNIPPSAVSTPAKLSESPGSVSGFLRETQIGGSGIGGGGGGGIGNNPGLTINTQGLGGSSSVSTPNMGASATAQGLTNWSDNTKYDGNSSEKSPDAAKLNRKESYKAQRKNYRREKKRVASELLNSLQDPAVIVLADWLKVRGTLKSWTKLWCVLKPGLLLLYKSPKTKSSHWVGTVLITSCQVIERPSKKDGFCFKLFHPMEQSIWAPRGPDKETIGAVVQPLPTAYLIFRAPSQAAGKCWMDALELSLRCSALLLRSNSQSGNTPEPPVGSAQSTHETQWSEADYEKHFNEHGKPQFLVNYIPPTPPSDKKTIDFIKPDYSSSSAESRSPTPIFQQLYWTMSNLERSMANSTEFKRIKDFRYSSLLRSKSKDDVSISSRSNCVSEDEDENKNLGFESYFKGKLKKSLSVIGKSSLTTFESSESDDDDNEILNDNLGVKIDKDLDADSQNEAAAPLNSGVDSESESDIGDGPEIDVDSQDDPPETAYVHLPEDEFGGAGEQVQELHEEQKSLIWFLVKQVRPGMDLSKVVLPTFILEPRSFLDKLSDSYYHADILSRAVLEDDPFTRMKTVVQWYLSGFYKKPKGLKKPYNPILGETFRCFWEHPNGSRTFYIAEQVSHHPPVSAFYVTNRQDGFSISCSILAKSKFYGNSTSAILEGLATLTLLPRGESYTLTVPYAHCKGILMGTLSMELGGKINIDCENTGYKTEIEFKLKPLIGGSEYTNYISGKIKLGKETMATINGHWDSEMRIKDCKTNEENLLFASTKEIRQQRLKRYVVPIESQGPTESERLWQHVTAAISRDDQVGATEEKTVLEEAQRNSAKERKAMLTEWIASHFQQDLLTGKWIYKYADLRPWDPRNDLRQYESDYRIITKTRHQAPMVRTASIVSSDPLHVIRAESRSSLTCTALKVKRSGGVLKLQKEGTVHSDSSQSNDDNIRHLDKLSLPSKNFSKILDSIENINRTLEKHNKQLESIESILNRMKYQQAYNNSPQYSFNFTFPMFIRSIGFIFIGFFIHIFIKLIYRN